MLVSIIIPFLNKWNLTHELLYSLYKYAPDNCEIVLVNDASTEEDCEAGVSWWQKSEGLARHKIRYRKNEKNLGFGGSHNAGARISKGDILIFLSNDVKMFSGAA